MLRDNSDAILDELQKLNENLQNLPGGDTVVNQGDTSVDQDKTVKVSEPSEETTANYFSTGRNGSVLSSTTDWERVPLGVIVKQVSVRATDDIEVAFRDPNQRESAIIPVSASETPFNMGDGDLPLETAHVWLRKGTNATSDPEVQLIARK